MAVIDAIQWSYALSSPPLDGGQHELTFASGFLPVCDILVCAYPRVQPLASSGDTVVSQNLPPRKTCKSLRHRRALYNGGGRIGTAACPLRLAALERAEPLVGRSANLQG